MKKLRLIIIILSAAATIAGIALMFDAPSYVVRCCFGVGAIGNLCAAVMYTIIKRKEKNNE